VITAAVVVHWHGRADTERCVASLLAPGGPDRVVLVDNGSGEAFDPPAEVLRLPVNRGFAGGADEGARRALSGGADLLLFLNNDAVLEPGALTEMAAALAADPGAAAAGPLIVRDDGTDRPWFAGGSVSAAFGQVTHGGSAGGGRRPTGFLTFCAVLVRREAWLSVGPLDEEFFAYGEDADWCLRARRAGFTLVHCPGARVLHRVNGSLGAGSPPQAYLLARARVLLARRHSGAASRGLLFWPWMLLVRGPHDFLKSLLTRGWGSAWAGVRGIADGARGGAPRAFRAELGLDGPGGAR
jgi:GT2 family glycosyltransferase